MDKKYNPDNNWFFSAGDLSGGSDGTYDGSYDDRTVDDSQYGNPYDRPPEFDRPHNSFMDGPLIPPGSPEWDVFDDDVSEDTLPLFSTSLKKFLESEAEFTMDPDEKDY